MTCLARGGEEHCCWKKSLEGGGKKSSGPVISRERVGGSHGRLFHG